MNHSLWKSLLTEFLGTFTLVFIGVTAVVSNSDSSLVPALAFGLTFAALMYSWGGYSGTHLNPAVSLGALVAGRMPVGRMLGYWLFQLLGALAGVALVYYFTSDYGVSTGSLTKTNTTAAVVMEGILTFFLVATFLLSTHTQFAPVSAALAIGFTIIAAVLVGYQYTGASMNPARSFGSAALANDWTTYWIYLVGPLVGALVAGLIFRLFNRDYVTGKDYDHVHGDGCMTCKA